MAMLLAGKVLGPRPGKAICSFWQGNMEVTLRIAASMVGSTPALVAAIIVLAGLKSGDISLVPVSTEVGSLGTASYTVLCATIGIVMELALIIVRILNIGLVNLKAKIFLIADVTVSILLAAGHLTGGVVTAYFASKGSESQVKNGLAASAAFCLLAVPLYTSLAVWSILFITNEWNKKVVSYTLKDAITG